MNVKEAVVGIDIGGTNTVCGIISLSGTIIKSHSFKTNSYDQFSSYCEKLSSVVKTLAGDTGVKILGAGIGAPNANYYTGYIDDAANLPWKGTLNLKGNIGAALNIPVTVTNDANAAAVGEMTFGEARGMKDFIMLTLGTGVGSGIVVNGKVVYGHTGLAGELGHVIMFENGRLCGCGRKGCLETYASATGIVRTVRALLERNNNSSLGSPGAGEINSHTIAQHASNRDKIALEAFDYTARVLALAIVNSVLFSSPEAIILSGGLSRAGELLMQPLEKHIDELIMPNFRGSFRVIQTSLPESGAAILGAAALAIWETEA